MATSSLARASDAEPTSSASGRNASGTTADDRPQATRLAVEAKALAVHVPWRIWLDLARPWAIIGAAIAACALAPTVTVVAICFVVIATQQYALLILMHDGQHSLLHPRRAVNNAIAKWAIGAPCGTPFSRSQAQHLAHHQTVGSDRDPAFQFYCRDEPSPKHGFTSLVVHFVRVLVLGRLGYSLVGEGPSRSSKKVDGTLASYGPILLAQAILFAIFALAGIWWAYFVLWALPLATLVSFFDAFRQFAEHAEPVPDRDAGSRLISTQSNVIERIFLAPYGMNYHAEHHMFPFVPYYRLPRLSALIRGSAAADTISWRRSYLSSLAIYLRGL
ncbi:fatty acid desaturase [Reyranella sp.]|uniref:fatty acid desaturase n=1 Tax=Reyranella sp. TaxID=1929291 RepID=UPI003BAAA598